MLLVRLITIVCKSREVDICGRDNELARCQLPQHPPVSGNDQLSSDCLDSPIL